MGRLRVFSSLAALGGAQGTIIPSLSSQDNGVKTITLEGSASLYEPVELLSQLMKEAQLELSIIPTGSDSGKDSHADQEVDFALSSISEKTDNFKNFNPMEKDGIKKVLLAKDPLVFLYKPSAHCKWDSVKYKTPLDTTSRNFSNLKSKPEEKAKITPEEYYGNRWELNSLFREGHGKFSDCEFSTVFIRAGGPRRSALNKILSSKGNVDSEVEKKIKENCQDKKPTGYKENSGDWTPPRTVVREAPENNYLALELFLRESTPGSIIFFPKSFYELNKEYISQRGLFKSFNAWDPTRYENQDDETETLPIASKPEGEHVFSKKLQLLIKVSDLSSNENKKNWIKHLLLGNPSLEQLSISDFANFYDSSNKPKNMEEGKEGKGEWKTYVSLEEKVLKKQE